MVNIELPPVQLWFANALPVSWTSSFILDEMEFTYDGILASMHLAGCTADEACLR